MITFSTTKNPEVRFLKIPPQIDSSHTFAMYCGDSEVGKTYGSLCGRIEVISTFLFGLETKLGFTTGLPPLSFLDSM